mgnify:CR=1 FL=1
MNNGKQKGNTRRMTGLAIFTAIIVVLQVLCTFVRFGPFSITLALAPIIIATAIYGKGAGAYLGGVFGLVVLMLLMSINPVACILICIVKGAAAGFLAGLCYEAIAKKNDKTAVIVSGIVCPVVNTGLFILGMLVFFFDTISGWAGGQNMLLYIIVGLTGVNFLVELGVNVLLAAGIERIIRAGKKMH